MTEQQKSAIIKLRKMGTAFSYIFQTSFFQKFVFPLHFPYAFDIMTVLSPKKEEQRMKEYEENKAQNEEEDEMVNVVTLNDEDGNEQDFEYIDSVEYEGKEYGFFLPMEEDASELVILQIEPSEENEDEEVFIGIDDEELLKKVFAIFKEKYQDEFDFEEE